MKNILAAVDFSDHTDIIIDKAANQAEEYKAKLWLLHIRDTAPEFINAEPGGQFSSDQPSEADMKPEYQQLYDYAQDLRNNNIETEAIFAHGPIAKTIIAEAKRLKADMIVMGTHGHSGLYNRLMGSTAEEILEKAEVPMLIIPHKYLKRK